MSSTPATSNNPICISSPEISLPEEISRLDHEVTPAMEPLVSLLQKLAHVAPTAIRNKHKLYSIILRAREIENYILAISTGAEVARLETLYEYYKLMDTLEEHLLRTAEILVAEQGAFNPELCLSWNICMHHGLKPGRKFDQSSLEGELANSIFFDDCYWFSFLLHEGIEKEFALQFSSQTSPGTIVMPNDNLEELEWEIKHGQCTEEARERAIDIATRLYESLSASTSENERDAASSVRQGERSFIVTDQDALIKEGYK
ncbi:hypothetical protein FRC00_000954 [Tulasnella sp. 408]|nr:hypothetical protein FRC00_000954 [Tulasnella sp. 408]